MLAEPGGDHPAHCPGCHYHAAAACLGAALLSIDRALAGQARELVKR